MIKKRLLHNNLRDRLHILVFDRLFAPSENSFMLVFGFAYSYGRIAKISGTICNAPINSVEILVYTGSCYF